ncbi:uncharacterized protein LOC123655785 [Melitaea cinxia]|uniref:uncharacterized protein LOC123655785 n=1 Tax=Melitaea cinxia TaxID=113334 RepID=UPI001E271D18|nr:uncharacterized protein LOC123655785 [Melitaea cinxia]
MTRSKTNLKVGFLNVGSLGTDHENFIDALQRHSFDVMALNETWLRPGEDGRAPVVPGYRLRHKPRPPSVRGGRGGGVGFYLRRGLSAQNSETLIDLICSDLPANYTTVEAFRAINGHSIIRTEFEVTCDKFVPIVVTYRPLKNISKDKFSSDLSLMSWQDTLPQGSVNDMVHSFNSQILALYNVHAPIKTRTIREPSYPWITDIIKLMMKLRDRALAAYRKNKTNSKKNYYKQLKILVANSLHSEKAAYFRYNINNKIKDPKRLWKNLRTSIISKNHKQELPPHFADPDAINSTFLSIPGNLTTNMSVLTYFEFHRFGSACFKIEPVVSTDIVRVFHKLKSNAEGYDHITLSMLLLTLPNSLEAITAIVNCSIATSTFPDLWKIAVVRPIPKKNDPVDVRDLRPISVLPCLSKVLEKVICQQLTHYLETNDILPSFQSGFRKHRSTATALLDVTDNILAAQDKGMCTLLVLLDFSRAFDSINVPLLLSKLNYFGFDNAAVRWFDSYLTNRKQLVELKLGDGRTKSSVLAPLKRGVPQGSILGPVLFNLYCADITDCFQKSSYHMYADDVQLYISFNVKDHKRAVKDLNDDLDRISVWSERNGLFLNPSKTKYMVFGAQKQIEKLPPSLNIMLLGKPIDRVDEARNLGLLIDRHLRYEKHVAESVRNCFYRLRVLYKIRPFLSEELREQLVEALVLSKLNYGDMVYGPRLLARTGKLIQRVQNACARFCYSIPFRTHVTPFLNNRSVLKMRARRKYHLACLLFGVIKYRVPPYLYEKLSWLTARRQCSQQLSIHPHKTAAFKGTFRYAAAKVWNDLPPPIRDLNTVDTFRRCLKQFLVVEQQTMDIIANASAT